MEPIDPTLTAMRVARALELGFSPGQLRGDQWTGGGHGLVRPAFLSVDPVMSRIAGGVALMSPSNVLGGWASLAVQGNGWFDGSDVDGRERDVLIHCLAGSQLRRRPGIRPSEGLLLADEIVSIGHYDVTTMARAVYDEMRTARGVREATVALDMATSTTTGSPHCSIAAVHRVIASHHKTRGITQARRALVLGSTRSASPWETRTRLVAELDAGIKDLLVNVPVFDRNERLLGVADLLDPESGLVIESDGAHHREAERHADDNAREERFERARLVVCRVTALDHRDRTGLAARLHAARLDAARERERPWRLQAPRWWHSWPPARRWD